MSFSSDYAALQKKRVAELSGSSGADTSTSNKATSVGNYNNFINDSELSPSVDWDSFYINKVENESLGDSDAELQALSNFFKKRAEEKQFKKVDLSAYDGYFSAGAFEDGYQFGDFTKTVFSTVGDTAANVVQGALGLVEGVADLIMYTGAGLSYAFGNDDLGDDFWDAGSYNFIGESFKPLNTALDKNSAFGEKTDAVAQGLGQVAGIMATGGIGSAAGLGAKGVTALTTGVNFASSMGSGIGEATNEGATKGEAVAYGAMKGAVDAGSELIFAGLGKSVNALGYNRGISSLDDAFAKKVSSKISSQFWSNAAEYGIKASAEGVEELLAGLGTAAAKWLTYKSDEELWQLIKDEKLLDQFIAGMVTSAIAQSGIVPGMKKGSLRESNKLGRDFVTGLSQNEQAVVDKEVEARIAEAEKGGKKLTKREKNKLAEIVTEELKKGYISTDRIESVLGGETYKSYRETVDSEEAIRREFEELGKKEKYTLADQTRYTELQAKIKELDNDTTRSDLRTKLTEEMKNLLVRNNGKGKILTDDYLLESYNESARRGQSFEADVSKYDEKQRETISRALNSGILNNTRRTHEFVDMLAKISADKGVLFDFTNNEKLKESGFAKDGKTVNGYVTKDGITLNTQSSKYLNSVVGHEITHVLEGTEFYAELQKAVFDYAKTKGEYDSRYAEIKSLYENEKGADVKAELTADLVGDYLFSDSDFINHLSTKHRNIFTKIFDEIKYLLKTATAGSKEARQLEKVKRAFENAYRESGKVNGDTKYSLSDSDGKQLTKEQNEYFKDSKMRDDNGNLKVMYHGSQNAGFHEFNAKFSDDDTSFFFVDRNDVAASYSGTSETYEAQTIRTAEDMNNFLAKIGYDSYKAVEKDGKFELLENNEHVAYSDTAQGLYDEFCWYEGVGEGDVNYKVYLNLKNPLEVDAGGRNWNNISREYSQEIADRYASLTAEEKAALVSLTEWGEYGVFKDEMLAAAKSGSVLASADEDISVLASAYEKLGGANANLYDAFSIASDNFSEDSIKEFAVKQMNTRDYAQRAKEQGYDGVIFKNLVDNGGYSNGSEGASTVAIAFDSNQIKSVANEKPTADPDIRYSLTEYTDGEKKAHNKAVVDYFGKTNSWAETGYVLLDGTKLDLSGRHEGAPGGYRSVDHRDIVDALGDDYGDGSYSGSLVQFMSEGNIRISPESNGINLSVKPTKAQEQALAAFISRGRGEMLLDIDDSNGYTVVSVEYPKGTYYTKILNDIREWFDNGKEPEVSGFSAFRSLSKNGEQPKRYGNYNVSGEDIRLNIAPTKEDISKTETPADNIAPIFEGDNNTQSYLDALYNEQAELEDKIRVAMTDNMTLEEDIAAAKLVDRYNEVLNEIAEAEAVEKGRVDSLTDTDAPPETDFPYYGDEETDTTPLNDESVKEIAETARDILAFDEYDLPKMQEIISDYVEGKISREDLFSEIKENFGTYEDILHEDETLKDIKRHIRRQKLKANDTIKGDMAYINGGKYGDFRKRNFGKIILTDKKGAGVNVDSYYEELNDIFGDGYFPSDIVNESDQLKRILDVMDMEDTIYAPHEIDNETLQEATNAIINGINEARQTELESLVESEGTAAMADLVRSEAEIAPVAEKTETIKPKSEKAQALDKEQALKIFKDVFGERSEGENIAPTYETTRGGKGKVLDGQRTMFSEDKHAEILGDEPETAKKKSRGWSHFVRNFVDKQSVFETLALKTKNRELQAKANQMHYAESSAQWLIGHGAEGVKSLEDIRSEVENTGLTKKFYEYMYHKHNVDRMTLESRYKDAKNKAVIGFDVTAEVSQEIVNQYEEKNPKFKEYAQDVYNYMSYLRNQLVDSGVISQETADLWAEMYPHYVPIRRVGDAGLNINVPLDTRKTGVNAPIKSAKGGNRDILPLFDTMALRTQQTYRAIAKNTFGVELKNTLGSTIESNTAHLDEVIDSIDKHEDLLKKGENGASPTFTVFENGQRVTFEITEDMYDALKPTSDAMAYTNKVLNKASNFRRGLITEYNPVFLATNAIKDVQDVLINSQHAAATYKNMPKAFYELATKGKWYTEYMENGGEQNTYFDGKTNTFKAEDNTFKKVVGMPLRAISAANNFIERAPRLAEYIASREAGASVEVAMLDAARVTTNFAAGGDVTKFLNRNGATFLNASVQGFNQQVRNVREAKAKGLKGWLGLATKFAIAGLPALLLNRLLWEDDEEYEELSDYVKQNYYVVAKYGDGKFVRIPKGRTVAVIQDAFQQVSNAATGDDEADFNSFFQLFLNNLAPNNPLDNSIISPIQQAVTNKTWYGEDLVPSRLQDLPKEEQYDESTDSLSKWLGEKLNISPYKINYVLDQYSGGVGDVFLPMMTPEAESGNNTLAGNLLAPWKDKFTTDSVMNNQNVSDFYDTTDELTTNAKSSHATDKDILKSKYMNSVMSELGELYKKKREIQNSGLDDAEKYEEVRDLQKQINELAKSSLNTYNDVYIEDDYAEIGDLKFRKNDKGEWTKISAKQAEKQEDVTEALGIDPSFYWENKSEYDFAYEYPEQYAVAKSVGGYESYKTHTSNLYDIKADKDKNGKSISGSRKEKVIDYINSLTDLDYGERIILFKREYIADDTYNEDIVEYLNSREDISYKEMIDILIELGFSISADGQTVTW